MYYMFLTMCTVCIVCIVRVVRIVFVVCFVFVVCLDQFYAVALCLSASPQEEIPNKIGSRVE